MRVRQDGGNGKSAATWEHIVRIRKRQSERRERPLCGYRNLDKNNERDKRK